MKRGEFTDENFSLDFQSNHKEKNRHQAEFPQQRRAHAQGADEGLREGQQGPGYARDPRKVEGNSGWPPW